MSELVTLYEGVKATLEERRPGVSVVFGRREPPKQSNQGAGRANRVVFAPGDPNGAVGEEVAPRGVGCALKDQLELFTVWIWGADLGDLRNEALQHDACWDLFCEWRAAMYYQAEGRAAVVSKNWVAHDRVELPFGMELRIVCTIRSQVKSTRETAIATGVRAHLTATELGVTRTATTTGEG